jgi:hypothetical protein
MTTRADPLDGLRAGVFALREAVVSASLIIGDAPLYGRVKLVDDLVDDVAELAGACEEALALAIAQADDRAQVLAGCHSRLLAARGTYSERLASYDVLTDVVDLGRYRGNDWEIWAAQVKEKIEGCRPALDDATAAVTDCLLTLVVPDASPTPATP